MTSLDEEIIVDVDLEKVIPCDKEKCDHEAKWLLIRKCCAHKEFKCDFHFREVFFMISKIDWIICFLCLHETVKPSMMDCYSYVGKL